MILVIIVLAITDVTQRRTDATIARSSFDESLAHSPFIVFQYDILYLAADSLLDTVYTHDIMINGH